MCTSCSPTDIEPEGLADRPTRFEANELMSEAQAAWDALPEAEKTRQIAELPTDPWVTA